MKRLKSQILREDRDQEAKSVCLATGKPDQYIKRMFDEVYSSDQARFPAALEILLVPGFVVAAIVHAPVKVVSGHAVPLGLLSFDPQVVARVQDLLLEELNAYYFADPSRYDELSLALSASVSAQPIAENPSDDFAPLPLGEGGT
jgi:hypothetical protein